MKEPGLPSPKENTSKEKEVERKAMPPPLSTSRLTRSRSIRVPENEKEPSRTATLRSHTRNQSAVISPSEIPRTGSGLKRPESLLIDQSSRPPSSASTVSKASTDTVRTNSRPGTATSHSRQASAIVTGLQRTASTATRVTRAASTASTTSAGSKTSSLHTALPITNLSRPAFSTLQQHYSPKKSAFSKPPVPTSKSLLAEPPTTGQISPDILNIQTRLLQLHLLHIRAASIHKQWEGSAEKALLKKFAATAALHHATRSKEHGLQERVNLKALEAWDTDIGLAEKLAVLAALLHELPALIEPDGRYTRLVNTFERWITWVESIHGARTKQFSYGPDEPKNTEVIDGIGATWKIEHAALVRKVAGLVRQAQTLDVPGEGSTPAVVVRVCKEMLKGMADELKIMQKIESEVEAREKEWVDGELIGVEEEIRQATLGLEKEEIAWGK